MARVTPGTSSWGDDLNADLDGIEALAQSALAAATIINIDSSMSGITFMSGTALPLASSVPTNTVFFLLPEA